MEPSVPRLIRPARMALAVLLLFAFAIPWWWRWFPATGNQIVAGAPLWFVTSIFGSALISLVTAGMLSHTWESSEQECDRE